MSLSGEVRAVSRMEMRMKEALKLGFGQALGPSSGTDGFGFPVAGVSRLTDAVRRIGRQRLPKAQRPGRRRQGKDWRPAAATA